MAELEILPGKGRGTMRSMVEGVLLQRCAVWPAPSTSLRLVPLPMNGEDR